MYEDDCSSRLARGRRATEPRRVDRGVRHDRALVLGTVRSSRKASKSEARTRAYRPTFTKGNFPHRRHHATVATGTASKLAISTSVKYSLVDAIRAVLFIPRFSHHWPPPKGTQLGADSGVACRSSFQLWMYTSLSLKRSTLRTVARIARFRASNEPRRAPVRNRTAAIASAPHTMRSA